MVAIPDGVATICDSAFANCNELTSVTIPDSVTNIGVSAFSDCNGLTNVTFLGRVQSLGAYAFHNRDIAITDKVEGCFSRLVYCYGWGNCN